MAPPSALRVLASQSVAPPPDSVALALAIVKSKLPGMTAKGERHLKLELLAILIA